VNDLPVSRLHVETCTTTEAFGRLETEWDALLDRSRSRSAFLSWGWLFPWWTHFGGARALRLVLVRDPSGRLVGAAPLLIAREGIGRTLRVLRFLGTEAVSSDYLDFLADVDLEQEVAAAIWQTLVRCGSSWDWLQLTDLLESSFVLEKVRPLAVAQRFDCAVAVGQTCPYLALPASREGYWQTLKLAMRNNLRRKLRNLDSAGAVYETTEAPSDMPAALEEFYRIHELRWESKGLTGNFRKPQVRAFHLQCTALLAAKGRLRFYWVRVGGRAVGVLYALQYKDVISNYQTGFDPVPPDPAIPHTKYSPGMALIGRCLEDAIDRHVTEFDFLRGPESYKFNWTRTYRYTHEITLVAPRNLTARARFWTHVAQRRSRTAIKRLLGRVPTPIP